MYGNRGNKNSVGNPINEPKGLPKTAFDSAKGNISSSVVVDPPIEVIIQGVGNFNFKYDCTTAEGSSLTPADFSGSQVVQIIDTDNDSLRLPISPCAVSSSGTSNVTFIYQGGL
tara:strand:+ start:707 stop:1048 length:342 start_codon:yes stop_codon:yes gene_type:complete